MAETTITGLPNATTPLDGTERVPMDQSGTTVDASTQAIANLANGAISSAVAAHVAAADPHPGYFAPAAQGVTNGNSHDHNGGDGAQIAYGSLSGLPPVALSDPTGITGADAVTNIISLTQAEYDAIATPSATTLYVITN